MSWISKITIIRAEERITILPSDLQEGDICWYDNTTCKYNDIWDGNQWLPGEIYHAEESIQL